MPNAVIGLLGPMMGGVGSPRRNRDGDRVGEDVRRTAMQAAASRWVPRLYLGIAAALVPWAAYLAVSLPQRSLSVHYRGTWVGFDLVLIVVLARIGWFAHRHNPKVVLTAAAGATLLVVDAWFDVTTAAPGSAHVQALLSAVFLELPGAVLCGLLARRGLAVLAGRGDGFPTSATPDGTDSQASA